MGGFSKRTFKPKSLKDKSVQKYAKLKSEGRGLKSLPSGGSKASRAYYAKKKEEAELYQKTLLGN
mgnify:CR=1 FL=1